MVRMSSKVISRFYCRCTKCIPCREAGSTVWWPRCVPAHPRVAWRTPAAGAWAAWPAPGTRSCPAGDPTAPGRPHPPAARSPSLCGSVTRHHRTQCTVPQNSEIPIEQSMKNAQFHKTQRFLLNNQWRKHCSAKFRDPHWTINEECTVPQNSKIPIEQSMKNAQFRKTQRFLLNNQWRMHSSAKFTDHYWTINEECSSAKLRDPHWTMESSTPINHDNL